MGPYYILCSIEYHFLLPHLERLGLSAHSHICFKLLAYGFVAYHAFKLVHLGVVLLLFIANGDPEARMSLTLNLADLYPRVMQ